VGECPDEAELERLGLYDPAASDAADQLRPRCYARQGRAHQALRQFDLCCRSLHEAMGVHPSQATLDLYRSLRGFARGDTVDGGRSKGHPPSDW